MADAAITGLALFFTGVTGAAVVAVGWHFRRRPVVALIAARDRDLTRREATVGALETAVAAERADGRVAQLDALETALARSRRELAAARAGAEFAPRR